MAVIYETHTADSQDSEYCHNDTVAGPRFVYQTFTTTTTYTAATISVKAFRAGADPGTLTLALRATSSGEPTGGNLAAATYDSSTLGAGTPGAWINVDLAATVELATDTMYAVVLYNADGPVDSSIKVEFRGSSDSSYDNGGRMQSTDGGVNWTATNTTHDLVFKITGTATAAVPTSDAYVSKKLVALGSDELWYESSAGTMSALAASRGQLDTTDFITMCEAYGKVFIANGANLKIADFVNTKLTVTALTTVPTVGSTVTQATSEATMIVDFVNGAKTEIYGRTTSGTFNTTNTLSGGSMDPETRVPSAVDEATTAPHWYDWTQYGLTRAASTNMPSKANLVCRYRGRLVLSGNEDEGHMWWMSKVGFPFNFTYLSTDPLTAVAGNNVDAGEVGDIVEALIPYGDDYLVFGCSSSIHLLDGDPAFAGSIDEKSDIVGIYGARAWCKDANFNLYFLGQEGLYRMDSGRSTPRNISELHLPNLISDWAPNQATKRIVLSYDPEENGVLLSVTTLANGTNLNYYYSLKTEGFYPDTYPTACGIYCSFNYDAASSAYKGLIFGSYDGYLREFLTTAKDDDAGASNTAISSYVTYPIIALSDDPDGEGKVTSMSIILAGGAANGAFSDSDGLTYEYHKGRDAETVLEDIQDGATAFYSASLTGTGYKNRIRKRCRGAFFGLKLYNSTASQTWAVNRINIETKPAGKLR